MPKKIEEKQVALKSNPFLSSLATSGSTYQEYSLDTVITVVAVKGDYDDWTAYYQTPWNVGPVAEVGNKLPEEAARQLFPEWSKTSRHLKWRP